ncbi:MAG: hypothetical protein WC734_00500 [Patescibacteria group bacterium]|jgi:hypothetical protein
MAASKRRRTNTSSKHRSKPLLPDAKLLSAMPEEKTHHRKFWLRRSSGSRGSMELNSSTFFFTLSIIIMLIFLAVAFVGAYYFFQRGANDKTSHSSLRNNSLYLTNQAARYRSNQNKNAILNNSTNRQSACTSLSNIVECQSRPDCTVEYSCVCDSARMQADKCDYELTPAEDCICGQSGFDRCIELVCPINR